MSKKSEFSEEKEKMKNASIDNIKTNSKNIKEENKQTNIKEKEALNNSDNIKKSIAKKDQFDVEKLKTIEKEIKKNKKKISKETNLKRTNILSNIFIAMFFVVYFAMLLKATANIPAIELLTDFKVFIISELISTIILLEVSMKRHNSIFFWFGIEMMLLGVSTIAYMNLYGFNYPNMGLFTSLCIGFFTIYYLIKIFIIALRK